jgi:histamine N-methyltransferase
LKDFSVRHKSADPLSLLSVGCGSGILDNPLLEALSGLGRRIVYTAIDPNAVACSRFRGNFGLLEMPNVRLEVRQETVESISCDQKFDIIHAVHSLYYFDDPAATIKRLLVRMRLGGKLLILQAPKAELNRLADCFWFHNQDVDIWFSERLETYLQEVDLAYKKTRIHGRVDVSRCFEAECAHGAMMLDFITQVNCRKLKQAAREQILGYLTAVAERDGDRVWVKHPVDAFVIDAPPADGDCLA